MAKKQSISLDSLKSSNRKGKNIDGKELRDFGNGKMEFDPEANGFLPDKEEERKSDREIALDLLDQQLEHRRAEVEEFNALIDKYDGVLTEEDYLKETGQEYVLDHLNDRMTEEERAEVESERAANRQKKQEEMIARQEKKIKMVIGTDEKYDDLDDIEKEILAEEDIEMPVAKGTPVVGEFNEKALQRQNGMPVMGAEDTYVDPNLNRQQHQQPVQKVAVEEPVAETSVDDLEDEMMEKEILSEKAPVVVTPKRNEVAVDAIDNVAISGKATYVAPVQQMQVVDENGLTEEEKDLAALDDDSITDDMDDDDIDTYWKKVGSAYNKKVKPVIKKLDLNACVVSSEPVTVSTIVNNSTTATHAFKWVLPVSGRPFTMKSFTASELNTLGTMAGTASKARDIIKALWDHIIEGRGDNFDQWCKVTSHKDLVHLWFGVYGACFDGANYVPYVCDKCKEATISDNIDILDMVEYRDDKVKEAVTRIRAMEYEPEMGKVSPVSRVQISDSIVIDFKDPSVYDILISSTIDNNTRQKYSEGSAMVPYIANIYFIDTSSGSPVLRPLNNKVYPGNEAKTLKRKAIEYSMVIRSLNSEQYSIISNYIAEMSEEDDDMVKYAYPEYTCDHCHETIDKIETTPSEMVFTRHRLALTEN